MSSTSKQAAPALHTQAALQSLKVLAEADPGALARILQPLQSLNIVPVSVRVDRVGDRYLQVGVEVAVADLSRESLAQMAAKLGQLPIVLAAVACD